jgi:DNA-binding NtrC family response regulator
MSPRPFYEDDDSGSTVHQRQFEAPDEPEAEFLFHVVSGPDQGSSFRLSSETPVAVFGKGPTADFRLHDPSVSRRHARLELGPAGARIHDEESTNGTRVNGVSITEARLAGGEELTLGDNRIAVHRGVPAAPEALPARASFGRMLGASRELRRLYPLLDRLAASTIPVVIEGETGTGKEILAEAIHEASPRAQGPFVVFDCTAVPSSMVEAELFGHERGAFTGAVTRHVGMLEQANGGTLFIDEIGDLDLALQPKLLRALERGEFRRIGGDRSITVDVRILAATRRSLEREVEVGRFRDDLFHRLAVGRVELPPLRRRRGDVTVLARAFGYQLGSQETVIPDDVLARWSEHSWPGNVRELRNAVARYLALGELSLRSPSTEQDEEKKPSQPAAGFHAIADRVIREGAPLVRARQEVIDAFETEYLEAMLDRHGGVVTRAAAAAGIVRRHFQRLRARGRDPGASG